MTIANDVNVDDEEMVVCKLCTNRVWIRKDRLENHVQKVHSPTAAPKKSFTTYKARIESNFPPKVLTNSPTVKRYGKIEITITSRSGQRIGKGICSACGTEQSSLWHYLESNQGAVDLCGGCKQIVFDRSFG